MCTICMNSRNKNSSHIYIIFALVYVYNVVTSVPDRSGLTWGCVGSPGMFSVGLEWSAGRLSGSGWIWNDR